AGHDALVEGQHAVLAAGEHVAVETPAVPLELLPATEQAGVDGHVEHPGERDPPRVAAGLALADQDRDAPVHAQGDPGVAAGPPGPVPACPGRGPPGPARRTRTGTRRYTPRVIPASRRVRKTGQ